MKKRGKGTRGISGSLYHDNKYIKLKLLIPTHSLQLEFVPIFFPFHIKLFIEVNMQHNFL